MKIDSEQIIQVGNWVTNRIVPDIEAEIRTIEESLLPIEQTWTTQEGRDSISVMKENIAELKNNMQILINLRSVLIKIAARIDAEKEKVSAGSNRYRGIRRDEMK